MTTRLSKIARLPKPIREELNHRLENGHLSRTILPWVNNLPETKTILAEIFHGNAITHQNLSEWRVTGYQDWLLHQDRLQWFARLEEEDTETSEHDGCGDTYEAISRFFIFEVGVAMEAARKIKDPEKRWSRVEPVMDKFTRLQNSYNWSRRVQLEYDKYNGPEEPSEPETEDQDAKTIEAEIKTFGPANLCSADFQSAVSPTCSRQSVTFATVESTPAPNLDPDPKRQGAGALQDAPRNPGATDPRASVLDCGSPLPLSHEEPQASDVPIGTAPAPAQPETRNEKPETIRPQQSTINQQLPPKCQPLPTLAPTPRPAPSPNSHLRSPTPQPPLPKPSQPPTWKTHKVHSLHIYRRRFRGVEG